MQTFCSMEKGKVIDSIKGGEVSSMSDFFYMIRRTPPRLFLPTESCILRRPLRSLHCFIFRKLVPYRPSSHILPRAPICPLTCSSVSILALVNWNTKVRSIGCQWGIVCLSTARSRIPIVQIQTSGRCRGSTFPA